jgi:hypothetical protein
METTGKPKHRLLAWCLAALLVTGALFGLTSCSLDSGFNTIEDFDVVVTLYTPGLDYSQFTTYAMPDSIAYLGYDPEEDDPPDRNYDDLILELVEENLAALNYVRVTDPEAPAPDLAVLVSITDQDWAAWVGYPWWGYWGWYPGYPGWGWGPGYGWYYPPCYYCGGSVYEFTTGTVIMDMLDFLQPPIEDEIPVLWSGALNGIIDEGSNQQQRITDGINQAFDQSPYLGTEAP